MLVPGAIFHTVIMQNAVEETADGTALDTWTGEDGMFTSAAFQVTGINGDTITWEATIDNSNWVAVSATNLASASEATTATADGLYRITCHGLRKIRARVSTYSAGTITVVGVAAA